jgi:hypothetical protein
MRRHRITSVVVLAGAFTLTLAGMGPALAHHKADHAGGPPASVQGGGDHDGDADGDTGTALVDSTSADPAPDNYNQHPSGKDKSGEKGGSGTQGHSESDPDEDENGGIDKAGGTATLGGDTDDQDGNNGCGNDDDFEDDNNGKCDPKPGGNGGGGNGGGGSGGGNGGNGVVLTPGGDVQAEMLSEATTNPPRGKVDPAVAGEAVAGAELAFTGAGVTPLVTATLLLFGAGLALLAMARRRAELAEERHRI